MVPLQAPAGTQGGYQGTQQAPGRSRQWTQPGHACQLLHANDRCVRSCTLSTGYVAPVLQHGFRPHTATHPAVDHFAVSATGHSLPRYLTHV
jgi:hypothetical protein